MLNEWADYRFGDPFPQGNLVKALGRSLNTLPGEAPDQATLEAKFTMNNVTVHRPVVPVRRARHGPHLEQRRQDRGGLLVERQDLHEQHRLHPSPLRALRARPRLRLRLEALPGPRRRGKGYRNPCRRRPPSMRTRSGSRCTSSTTRATSRPASSSSTARRSSERSVSFSGEEREQVDIRNERASVSVGGKEVLYVGPAVHSTVVLCRKARPGCKFD